jgi:hypothetical protein
MLRRKSRLKKSPLHAKTFAKSKRSTFVLLFFAVRGIRAKVRMLRRVS